MKNEFTKFLRGFRAAGIGLRDIILSERNFRFHLCMAAYVIFFAIIGSASPAQIAALCACIALVLTAEIINTAIELLCDRITEKFDEKIGRIKDISAAAVLVCAALSALGGLFIFLSSDVFFKVFDVFFTYSWVLICFLISIPLALIFIFCINKKP